ncbi:hypothetical protein JI664_01635 [Rhodobacter sp. NTK016B]|uniref:hypothetical protein n=1 Tax=Rhodobacter sp. NTK016B TaxID=2759676 RepID=UPI001A8C7745|nr:hypothetical protein [Rhodobacter sp. NTK016B]MBN8290655.1 hypothetical protein [Rhodobacter sp. NTK016B]
MVSNRPPEIFRIDPIFPRILAVAAVCFILYGTYLGITDDLGVSFAGVGVLIGLACIPFSRHAFAALYDDHLRVGKEVIRYRDIVAVMHGELALGRVGSVRDARQPFLLIQTRQSEVPKVVRVAFVQGGVARLRARLELRVAEVNGQSEQTIEPST